MGSGSLGERDAEICEAYGKELRAAFDEEKAVAWAKAKAAGIAEATDEISNMVGEVFGECDFTIEPGSRYLPGISMLAEKILEHAQKADRGSPEARFGFSFAGSLLGTLHNFE